MTVQTTARSRVLLVEDEALIAMLMEDMLLEYACEVSATAAHLDEAVAVAQSQMFDMAFIDVNLQGVPAFPVAEVLQARGIPFAFVTGYGAAGTDPAYADVPVLQKPFRGQELEAIVQHLRLRHRPTEG